jgi:hypothetical protein
VPAAAAEPQIGTALQKNVEAEAAPATSSKAAKAERSRRARTTTLRASKPHAGTVYRVHMRFGRVPVATAALAVGCRARLSGASLTGKAALTGHVATCAWKLPADARGERLVVTVKVSGRHGVSLVRHARLIVGA